MNKQEQTDIPNITTEYDDKFAGVDGMQWWPWVGKGYNKTRVMVLGTHTSWDRLENDTSRQLPLGSGRGKKSAKAFTNFANMFLREIGAAETPENHDLFWQSVAFNNLVQRPVADKMSQPWENDPDYEKCLSDFFALMGTFKIIQPDLIIFWSNSKKYDWETFTAGTVIDTDRVGRFTPIIFISKGDDWDVVGAGIYHPSMTPSFNGAAWMKFLLSNADTGDYVKSFIDHLKTVIPGK